MITIAKSLIAPVAINIKKLLNILSKTLLNVAIIKTLINFQKFLNLYFLSKITYVKVTSGSKLSIKALDAEKLQS